MLLSAYAGVVSRYVQIPWTDVSNVQLCQRFWQCDKSTHRGIVKGALLSIQRRHYQCWNGALRGSAATSG